MSESSRRLASLDALRGRTVAAMLRVNDPGQLGSCLRTAQSFGVEQLHAE